MWFNCGDMVLLLEQTKTSCKSWCRLEGGSLRETFGKVFHVLIRAIFQILHEMGICASCHMLEIEIYGWHLSWSRRFLPPHLFGFPGAVWHDPSRLQALWLTSYSQIRQLLKVRALSVVIFIHSWTKEFAYALIPLRFPHQFNACNDLWKWVWFLAKFLRLFPVWNRGWGPDILLDANMTNALIYMAALSTYELSLSCYS